MSLRIVFTPNAWEDYDGWLRRDVKMVRRISKLILDVQRDPHGTGLGKPELLKGPLSGWSSRRINDEHRLIYRVRGGDLEIAACHGHYLDK
ncbi:Txe/YoeB family addiction module toxin [Verrucosispora sp. WMMD573]|uniref:Txe/YoeB family addiction module toxin n=1 Tax=Verrucosispora sp. WMMD573 TaxID=3015149 RepID=UPI00248D10FA|nr:Txe/YoeB family addiction module toxin [Verrucosispora sp. WMMD573]WBB54458.1 Txe/YoeB family addiction module toxin [Verrucosispora sp. WMMD573]